MHLSMARVQGTGVLAVEWVPISSLEGLLRVSDGKSTWDGQAEFNVRPASEEEIAHFKGPDPYPPHAREP